MVKHKIIRSSLNGGFAFLLALSVWLLLLGGVCLFGSACCSDWNEDARPALFALGCITVLFIPTFIFFRNHQKRFVPSIQDQECRQRLQRALDSAGIGIWYWDIPNNRMEWSDTYKALHGYPADIEPSFDRFIESLHPEYRQQVDEAVRLSMANRTGYIAEHPIRLSDGSERWIAINLEFYYGEDGAAERMEGTAIDITERKRREETLGRSQEPIMFTSAGADIGIWHLDLAVNRLHWSESSNTLLGLPSEQELSFDVFLSMVHPEDRQRAATLLSHATQSHQYYAAEFRILSTDGTERWFEAKGQTYFAADGRPHAKVGIVLDISSERQSARRMDQIVMENRPIAKMGAWKYIVATQNTNWSEGECAIFGLEPGCSPSYEEMLRRYIHRDDAERLHRTFCQALQAGESFELENRIVRPDGVERIIHNLAYPHFDARGQLIKYMGISLDVTERKAAELELEQHRIHLERLVSERTAALIAADTVNAQLSSRLKLATQAVGLGIWSLDSSNNLLEWDGRMYEFFEIPKPADPSLFSLESWLARVHPDDREVIECAMQTVLRECAPVSYIYRILLPDNRVRYIKAAAIIDCNVTCCVCIGKSAINRIKATSAIDCAVTNRPRCIVGTSEDITERKMAEAALLEADRHKDEFLAMLAHELRNPLVPINNAALILARLQLDHPQVIWAQNIIARQVNHLSRILGDLLDVSRIAHGKILLQKEQINLSEVIEQVQTSIQSRLEAKRHRLGVKLPEHPVYVKGDPVRLTQVVINLLDNAVKFSPEGESIELGVQLVDEQAEIEVVDHGSGIPAELLPKVFDLFQQAERTLDRSQGGLGIGLTLVKKLVELHGGSVSVSSPGIGMGSSFIVRLPAISCIDGIAEFETSSVESSHRAKTRVLVVDDDEAVRESTVFLMQAEGYETLQADSGEQALRIIEESQPDVVLLDIGLPRENGYEVARRIRQLPNGGNLRLIAVSGYGQAADREQALAAGFDYHVTKPFQMGALWVLFSK